MMLQKPAGYKNVNHSATISTKSSSEFEFSKNKHLGDTREKVRENSDETLPKQPTLKTGLQ